MPEKWYKITGKFNSKEHVIIQQYLEETKLNKNQLVQNAIKHYIPMFTGVNNFNNSENPFLQDLLNEISKILNSKEYKKQSEKIGLKLLKKYSSEEINSEIKNLEQVEIKQKELEEKHHPVGRPKIIRKRGRPRV